MVTGTYERWPVEKPVVKENVRKQFDGEGLQRAGERTRRAAKLAGLTHVCRTRRSMTWLIDNTLGA